MPKKVTGIGGIFFKSAQPDATRQWYSKHLGLNDDQYGTTFKWRDIDNPEVIGQTVWSTFKQETQYFAPSTKEFMINFRVENLEWLVTELQKEGIELIGELQVYDYGKFAHIMDPDGNKIELWEPTDHVFSDSSSS
jgi:predicted enzyme related to lactoylglutathione lyase